MPKKAYEIYIDEIRVEENGILPDKKAVNVISFEAARPRRNVSGVLTVLAAKLEDGTAKDFKEEPLKNRLIFKEEFEGSSEIYIDVLVSRDPSDLGKFLVSVLGVAAGAALGTVSGGILPVVASKVIASGFSAFSEAATKEKNTDPIAHAVLELPKDLGDGGTIVKKLKLRTHKTKPITITQTETRRIAGRPDKRRKVVTLKKADKPNGYVIVRLNPLDD